MALDIDYSAYDLGLSTDDMLDLEEDDVTEEAHWEIESKEFKAILSVIKAMVARSPIPKMVRFESSSLGLKISSTDSMSFVQYDVSILNSKNIMQGSFTVPFSSLESLVMMLPKNKTVIYLSKDVLYVQLVGGSFPVYCTSTDIFSMWDKVSIGEKIGKIKTGDTKRIIHDLLPYITSSDQIQDRKISLDSENGVTYAFASYLWSMVRTPIQAEGISSVDLRFKDLQIIKLLLNSTSSDHIHLYEVNGMSAVAIQSLNYSYYFVKSTPYSPSLTRKILGGLGQDNQEFLANYSHLLQVVKFANQNQDILPDINFIISDSVLFIEVALSNGTHSTFKILGVPSKKLPNFKVKMNKEVVFNTLKAVTLNEESSDIKIRFSPDFSYCGFSALSDSVISCTSI